MVTMSVISLTDLKFQNKRQSLSYQIKKKKKRKQDPSICCLRETRFRPKDTYGMKVKGWEKLFHANGNKLKSWGSNACIRKNRL